MQDEHSKSTDPAVGSTRLVRRCDTWETAFDLCRERNAPLTVSVPAAEGREVAVVFPSGSYRHRRYEPDPPNVPDQR